MSRTLKSDLKSNILNGKIRRIQQPFGFVASVIQNILVYGTGGCKLELSVYIYRMKVEFVRYLLCCKRSHIIFVYVVNDGIDKQIRFLRTQKGVLLHLCKDGCQKRGCNDIELVFLCLHLPEYILKILPAVGSSSHKDDVVKWGRQGLLERFRVGIQMIYE